MATTITGISKTKVLTNLDTYNHTATVASMYNVKCVVSEMPPSGVILTMQKNGTPVATTTVAPAARQKIVSLATTINCAVSDLISVVISSAVITDTGKNAIKATLNIHTGSV